MSLDRLKARLPEYAKDLKLNLSSLAEEASLSPQQRGTLFLASAIAARNLEVVQLIEAEYAPKLSAEAVQAAKVAAALMSMNNIYYRFTHLVSHNTYQKLPAKLRMNGLAKPGIEKVDFELCSVAVSAINGCGMCVDSHESILREHGVSVETIQSAVRIAATIHAVAATLDSTPVENVLAQAA